MTAQPKAPTKTVLNREYILKSALYLIDTNGLEALNLRALGQQMGVSQTAIYRHIPNKAALLDGVVELIWKSATHISHITNNMSWQDGLESVVLEVYKTILTHPNAIPLMATRSINTQQSQVMVRDWLDKLQEHGLQVGTDTILMFNSLACLTLGAAIAQVEPPTKSAGGEVDTDLINHLSEQYPALATFMSPLMELDSVIEVSYRKGLHALISGWAQSAQ
ncbi:hypothetical protein KIMH_05370 [Bombiscardovia apis]|uniref:HTH tetR-type domain-containing protein n=2 Tax=Bombiscardovia apis TaxID=2932182 RepID=A0ABN6SHN2_9BIFI|nr:hypothetical protein KIMH_05370 [Bombiscardovia apis]